MKLSSVNILDSEILKFYFIINIAVALKSYFHSVYQNTILSSYTFLPSHECMGQDSSMKSCEESVDLMIVVGWLQYLLTLNDFYVELDQLKCKISTAQIRRWTQHTLV